VSEQSDKNLFYAIVAFQNKYITAEQFGLAAARWRKDPSQPIGDVLHQLGFIDETEKLNIQGIVADQLRRRGDIDNSLSLSLTEGSVPPLEEFPSDWLHKIAELPETKILRPEDFASPPEGSKRYKLLRSIGDGGQGVVWEADDLLLNRRVAIKLVNPKYANDPVRVQSLLEESRKTGRIEHPGVAPIYDVGEFKEGDPYFTMRLVRGEKLKDMISQLHTGTRSKDDFLAMLRPMVRHLTDVCRTIQYANDKHGVIHRDLKPDNVMVSRYGETVVVDWGMGKSIRNPSELDEEDSVLFVPGELGSGSEAATQIGTIKGTFAYLSPEQANGHVDLLDHRTDIFGVGATLYEMLVGKPPFHGGGWREKVARAKVNNFESPRKANALVTNELEAICLKAMATKQSDRYATAGDMADDLENWIAGEPVKAFPEGSMRKVDRWVRRHTREVLTAFAATLLGIGLLTWATLAIWAAKNKEIRAKNQAIAAEQEAIAAEQEAIASETKAKDARVYASSVIDQILGEIVDDSLGQIPNADEVRISLLGKVADTIDSKIKDRSEDQDLKMDLINVLTRLAPRERYGRVPQAELHFRQASELLATIPQAVRERTAKSRDDWEATEADLLYYLGEELSSQGKLNEMTQSTERAIQVAKARYDRDPSDVYSAVSYGRALMQRSQLLITKKDFGSATTASEDGTKILRPWIDKVLADPKSFVDEPNDKPIYAGVLLFGADTYSVLGECQFELGNLPESIQAIQEALKISDLARQFDPRNGALQQARCLRQLQRLCFLAKKQQEADAYYQRLTELIAANNEDPNFWMIEVVSESDRARSLALSDVDEATAAMVRAETALDKMLARGSPYKLEAQMHALAAKRAIAEAKGDADSLQRITSAYEALREEAKAKGTNSIYLRELGSVRNP